MTIFEHLILYFCFGYILRLLIDNIFKEIKK